ncbi:hypothetical protein BT63DRAFT_129500 [Microthyrium microscopicum]|uniref:Uncharacterized protein n=1 Tax=Microthyrium microscopicum TaxID=703497 RepID=A0A6A6TWI0_9PEZI|nr:hypothetical protein BT63DRAFT_129500 [Microthyrium microscopicum]
MDHSAAEYGSSYLEYLDPNYADIPDAFDSENPGDIWGMSAGSHHMPISGPSSSVQSGQESATVEESPFDPNSLLNQSEEDETVTGLPEFIDPRDLTATAESRSRHEAALAALLAPIADHLAREEQTSRLPKKAAPEINRREQKRRARSRIVQAEPFFPNEETLPLPTHLAGLVRNSRIVEAEQLQAKDASLSAQDRASFNSFFSMQDTASFNNTFPTVQMMPVNNNFFPAQDTASNNNCSMAQDTAPLNNNTLLAAPSMPVSNITFAPVALPTPPTTSRPALPQPARSRASRGNTTQAEINSLARKLSYGAWKVATSGWDIKHVELAVERAFAKLHITIRQRGGKAQGGMEPRKLSQVNWAQALCKDITAMDPAELCPEGLNEAADYMDRAFVARTGQNAGC